MTKGKIPYSSSNGVNNQLLRMMSVIGYKSKVGFVFLIQVTVLVTSWMSVIGCC